MRIKNKRGFTLIEVIIGVLVITMLAVMALNSYFNSTNTFSFLNTHSNIMMHLRNARSYAINDKQFQNTEVQRYGVCLYVHPASRINYLTVFADNGNKPLAYEYPGPQLQNKCRPAPQNDNPPLDQDINIASYTFPAKYILSAYESIDDLNRTPPLKMPFPLLIFYERGNGNFTMVKGGSQVVSKTANKYVIIKLDDGTRATRYLVIYLVSGLVEEYANLDSL